MLNVERKPISSFLLCFFFRPIASAPHPFPLDPFPLPVSPEFCGDFSSLESVPGTHAQRTPHPFRVLSYSPLKSIMYRYVRCTCWWLFNTLLSRPFPPVFDYWLRLFSVGSGYFVLPFHSPRSCSFLALVEPPCLFPVSGRSIYQTTLQSTDYRVVEQTGTIIQIIFDPAVTVKFSSP